MIFFTKYQNSASDAIIKMQSDFVMLLMVRMQPENSAVTSVVWVLEILTIAVVMVVEEILEV